MCVCVCVHVCVCASAHLRDCMCMYVTFFFRGGLCVDHHVFSDSSMIPEDKGTLLCFDIHVMLKLLWVYTECEEMLALGKLGQSTENEEKFVSL